MLRKLTSKRFILGMSVIFAVVIWDRFFRKMTDREFVQFLIFRRDAPIAEALKRGANINARTGNGAPVLQLVIEIHHFKAAKELLEAGADINPYKTYLILALERGQLDLFNDILNAVHTRPDVDFVEDEQYKAILRYAELVDAKSRADERRRSFSLWSVAAEGDSEAVDVLLRAGIDLSLPHNKRALIEAAHNGHTAIVDTLLKAGIDVNFADVDGRTALMRAGKIEIINLLLKAGADVHARDREGKTALFYGASGKAADILIKAGADVNVLDKHGRNALFYAHTKDKVEVLLRENIDIHILDEDNYTPLFNVGCYLHFSEAMAALIKAGVDVNVTNKYGRNAIFYVNDEEEVEALVKAGINVNAVDNEGDNALLHMAKRNFVPYISLLVALKDAGCDVNFRDTNGRTALDNMRSNDAFPAKTVKFLEELLLDKQ